MENWKRWEGIGGDKLLRVNPVRRFGGSAVARLDRRVTTTVQASGWIRMTIVVDNKLDGQVATEFVYLNTVHSLYHRG
jgi:hypothetical protein